MQVPAGTGSQRPPCFGCSLKPMQRDLLRPLGSASEPFPEWLNYLNPTMDRCTGSAPLASPAGRDKHNFCYLDPHIFSVISLSKGLSILFLFKHQLSISLISIFLSFVLFIFALIFHDSLLLLMLCFVCSPFSVRFFI